MATQRLGAALAVLAAAALLVVPAAAASAAPSGTNFGQHVRACAQTMGFSGDHNPGMHRGARGWDHHHHHGC